MAGVVGVTLDDESLEGRATKLATLRLAARRVLQLQTRVNGLCHPQTNHQLVAQLWKMHQPLQLCLDAGK